MLLLYQTIPFYQRAGSKINKNENNYAKLRILLIALPHFQNAHTNRLQKYTPRGLNTMYHYIPTEPSRRDQELQHREISSYRVPG